MNLSDKATLDAVVETLSGGPIEFHVISFDHGTQFAMQATKKLFCGCQLTRACQLPPRHTTAASELATARAAMTAKIAADISSHQCKVPTT